MESSDAGVDAVSLTGDDESSQAEVTADPGGNAALFALPSIDICMNAWPAAGVAANQWQEPLPGGAALPLCIIAGVIEIDRHRPAKRARRNVFRR